MARKRPKDAEVVRIPLRTIHELVACAAQMLPDPVPLLYGIPTGGTIVATMLCKRLRRDGRPVEQTFSPSEAITHHNLVLVDDIVDSGETLRHFKRMCRRADALVLFQNIAASTFARWSCRTVKPGGWLVFPWEPDFYTV